MDKLSYHGKSVDQARWVLEIFGTPEKCEYYKGNKSFELWLEDCRNVIAARELDY